MHPPNADLGSSTIFSGVFEQTFRSKCRTTDIKAILASNRAKRIAKQDLGPCPKPRKVYLEYNSLDYVKKFFGQGIGKGYHKNGFLI